MSDVVEHIDNGLAKTEHVLQAAPATLDDVAERLASLDARITPTLDRINAVLDGFEAFSESPMGRMMMKRMSKGEE